MSPEEFVKKANDTRRATKNKEWYRVEDIVEGRVVHMQAYGTWIRNLKINTIEHGYVSGISVKDYKAYILQAVSKN